jgi:hypothetical protein
LNRDAEDSQHQFLFDAIQARYRRFGFHILDDESTVTTVSEVGLVVADVNTIHHLRDEALQLNTAQLAALT